MFKPQKVQLTLKQLFQALPEKYKYITCDKYICFDTENVQRYINVWKFEPNLGIELGRPAWLGAKKTNKELGYDFDLEEIHCEMPYILQTNFIWEIVEFKSKDTKDCIAKRADYI